MLINLETKCCIIQNQALKLVSREYKAEIKVALNIMKQMFKRKQKRQNNIEIKKKNTIPSVLELCLCSNVLRYN